MSDDKESGPFNIRFLPRPRHRPRVANEKKPAREVEVVRLHDLTKVHDFLVALISREQESERKALIAWDSVQRRYRAMVMDADNVDRDLLDSYQLDLGFFKEDLDEQVLEVWTGKPSVIDVLALPEFDDIDCVREPVFPYGLLIMLNGEDKQHRRPTSSVSVGTEDVDEPVTNSKLKLEFSKPSSDRLLKEKNSICPLLPCPSSQQHPENSDSRKKKSLAFRKKGKGDVCDGVKGVVAMTERLEGASRGEKQEHESEVGTNTMPTNVVPPKPSDLPDPLAFFAQDCTACGNSNDCAEAAFFQSELLRGVLHHIMPVGIVCVRANFPSVPPRCMRKRHRLPSRRPACII